MTSTSGPASHRVSTHLRLAVDEYDAAIRRWIPDYEEMLTVAAGQVLAGSPDTVLDLGAGTGALSQAVLASSHETRVVLMDVDPEMLGLARGRLNGFGGRTRFVERSFREELPPAHGVMASLALHHIPTLEEKTRVFAAIAGALPEGGLFVNADATVPSEEAARRTAFRAWADHMVAHGIPEARAWEHFREWSEEDTYLPLEAEMAALDAVGLQPHCVWRNAVISVVVARKR